MQTVLAGFDFVLPLESSLSLRADLTWVPRLGNKWGHAHMGTRFSLSERNAQCCFALLAVATRARENAFSFRCFWCVTELFRHSHGADVLGFLAGGPTDKVISATTLAARSDIPK